MEGATTQRWRKSGSLVELLEFARGEERARLLIRLVRVDGDREATRAWKQLWYRTLHVPKARTAPQRCRDQDHRKAELNTAFRIRSTY
jgi:hypothetical protein